MSAAGALRRRGSILALLACALAARFAFAHDPSAPQAARGTRASCVGDPAWIAPQAPVRVHGDTWHVGPRGLGVFLITSPAGHVLIDGGVPAHTQLIEANVRSLGIDPRAIRWILTSHAHCDHAGGVAELARVTGAEVIASAADQPLLARGGRDDPQFGDRFSFPPVAVARTVHDGERLQLGGVALTAHATPGHTRGNTTWTWRSCEAARCLDIALVGSLSAPGYRLLGNRRYPAIVADYEASFVKIAALPCDIALAPHPDMVDFWERVGRRDHGDAEALVDPTLCGAYVKEARADFTQSLDRQRAAMVAASKQRR